MSMYVYLYLHSHMHILHLEKLPVCCLQFQITSKKMTVKLNTLEFVPTLFSCTTGIKRAQCTLSNAEKYACHLPSHAQLTHIRGS